MKIFGWAGDESGCGYYRIEQPLQALRTIGYETAHDVLMYDTSGLDVIVGQRVCKPAAGLRWQQLATRGQHRLVFELDDDVFEIAPSSRAHAFYSRPDVRAAIERNIRVADAVTVSTAALAERLRPFNANVHIVPNHIPAWLLDHTPQRRGDRITIGWGGSFQHDMDFESVRGPLRRFLSRNPGVEFHAIGTDYAAWMRLPEDQCRFTPWIPDVPAFFRAIDYHIAVAPLHPHPFNQAKSWIKFLETAALGIPMVASDVGPYAEAIRHGETGFLVRRDHEWEQYLRALVNDEAMRKEIGEAAREWARDKTIEGNVQLWEKVLVP